MSDEKERHLHAVPDDGVKFVMSGTAVFRYKDTVISSDLFQLLMRRDAARDYLTKEVNRIREEINSLTSLISDQSQEEGIDPALFEQGRV